MSVATSDRIEKRIMLNAPRARVWKALTNAEHAETRFVTIARDTYEVLLCLTPQQLFLLFH